MNKYKATKLCVTATKLLCVTVLDYRATNTNLLQRYTAGKICPEPRWGSTTIYDLVTKGLASNSPPVSMIIIGWSRNLASIDLNEMLCNTTTASLEQLIHVFKACNNIDRIAALWPAREGCLGWGWQMQWWRGSWNGWKEGKWCWWLRRIGYLDDLTGGKYYRCGRYCDR